MSFLEIYIAILHLVNSMRSSFEGFDLLKSIFRGFLFYIFLFILELSPSSLSFVSYVTYMVKAFSKASLGFKQFGRNEQSI